MEGLLSSPAVELINNLLKYLNALVTPPDWDRFSFEDQLSIECPQVVRLRCSEIRSQGSGLAWLTSGPPRSQLLLLAAGWWGPLRARSKQ